MSIMTIITTLEKAMHSHLKPFVPPVVLCFHYEPPPYPSPRAIMHPHINSLPNTKFQQIGQRYAELLMIQQNLPHVLSEGDILMIFLRAECSKLNQIWKNIGHSSFIHHSSFIYHSFIIGHSVLQSASNATGMENRWQVSDCLIPIKIRGGMGEMAE